MQQTTEEAAAVRHELAALAAREFDINGVTVNHRPVIGWGLNDALAPEQLTAQVRAFKRNGYGGVMLMAWRGAPYAVMSDEWLAMVGHILDAAQAEGLEVWIWDDWCFPSGPAGGLVTRDDDSLKSKVLRIAVDIVLEAGESVELRAPTRAITAAVFPADKFTNPRGAFRRLPAVPGELLRHTAAERERLVVICWQRVSTMQHTPSSQMADHDIYSSDDPAVFSIDMLNPVATQRFIEVIHQRYWERFRAHFGKTLKGFFYDEPGLPNLFPWTEGFAEAFRQRKGYDLLEWLAPVLVEHKMYDIVFDLQSDEIKRVKADYMDVWTSLAAETFYGGLQRWCRAHGVACTGHQSNDESLKPVVSTTGHYFKNMAFNDMPGTDVVFSQLDPDRFADFPRLAGSRAHVLGRPGAISESFAVTGHGMDLDALRYIAEHQIIRGVNKFFPMMANYNPQRGLYFHPPELSDANLLIRHYGPHLFDRVTTLCALMSSGSAPDKVALFVPSENYYLEKKEIADELDALARALVYHQREFDYVWDQDLLEMTVCDGRLVSAGGQRFTHLIVPCGALLPDTLARQLTALAAQGIDVLAPGEAPPALAHVCRAIPDRARLLTHIADPAAPVATGAEETPVSLARRVLDDSRQLVMLLNETTAEQTIALTLSAGWQLVDIALPDFSPSALADEGTVILSLPPCASRLLLLAAGRTIAASPAPLVNETAALALETWELALPDGQTAQLSMPLPSWNDLGYAEYHGVMRYRTTFTWEGAAGDVALSLGDLRYAATVLLDGAAVGDCVFSPRRVVLPALQPGAHTLEIAVLNTMANLICATDEQYQRLQESGALKGTYYPLYIPRDTPRVVSGLLGPVTLCPMTS